MRGSSNIAFKEWAVVVEALGNGEQLIILRKGGIHEDRGQFRPAHEEFWLFPTQFHEAESSVIASKRPALRALAAAAPTDNTVAIRDYAIVEDVYEINDLALLKRLQGRHIWSEHVLEQRFEFGRQHGLFAFVVRVYRRDKPITVPLREEYGGCKSWIELEQPLITNNLTAVLDDQSFAAERAAVVQLLSTHALAHT